MKSTDDMKWVYWLAAGLILCMAIYSNNTKAETAVIVGGWSKHLITNHGMNETHDALLIEHDHWLAGRFKNSYNRTTTTLAYGWHKQWGDWRGSVHAGLMYGYRSCYGDNGDRATVCPMVYPSLSYTRYRAQPTVGLLGEALVFTVRVGL